MSGISYEEALARASSKHEIDVDDARETAAYWVFPVLGIGCCGVLVEKMTGKLVEFGSHTGIDDWVWGYEQGLLDHPTRDLVVISVNDADRTYQTLRQFIIAYVVRARLEHLPATFEECAGWQSIKPLRDAGDAFVWRSQPPQV